MFEIKTKARYLTHGIKTKARLFSFLPLLSLACAAVLGLTGALCAVYGASEVFAGTLVSGMLGRYPWTAKALTAGLFAAAGLCLIARFSLSFTLRAIFFHRTDKNQTRPVSFVSFGAGVKALACETALFFLKTGTVLVLLIPAAGTVLLTLALLRAGTLTKPLLVFGAAAAAAQGAAALAAGYVLNRRFCLTRYLLYLNPLMGVRAAVGSGVLLMRGKLCFAAGCGLAALPWRLGCLFAPTRPFAYSYVRLIDAAMCERLFAEDKYRPGVPAVCFIIDRRSRFTQSVER